MSATLNILIVNSIAQPTWIQKADMTISGRNGACSFFVNGMGYVGLGLSGAGNYPNDFQKYNPTNNTWSTSV